MSSFEYRYDLLGRLENIFYSDVSQNVTLTYDGATNRVGRCYLRLKMDPPSAGNWTHQTGMN
jgi:hypothetical protein